jgi:3-oxoacyl-[acyl-carrier-protein] synthase-3
MPYGLVAFGTAVGEMIAVRDIVAEYTEDVERVLSCGYDYVHRATADVGLTDLGVDAGARALAAAGVSPKDVDLVVLALTDIAEYLYWDAAAVVAHRLGVGRAESVLVDQGCIGGITAFDTLAGRFATHPDYRTALLIGANRTTEAYWNRLDTHSLLFSDGAAAAVATRGAPSLRWLASYAETDGRYADFFRMDVGGGADPFRPGAPGPTARDAWDIMEHFGYDPDRFTAFADEISDRTARAVHEACRRAGLTEDDLRWLVLLNDNPRVLARQAELIGIPIARTNLRLATQHAHFGAGDHLFTLSSLRESRELARGEMVALAANGRGMHWASAILQF